MLARSRGVPMVVGLGAIGDRRSTATRCSTASMAASCSARAAADVERFRSAAHDYAARRARADDFLLRAGARPPTARRSRVHGQHRRPADVDAIDIAHLRRRRADAHRIPVRQATALPDEETQYRAYRKVLEWAAGKPVTIRTLDAGGDKPVPGFTVEESNPFLGLRGIRLSLARPEIFRVQLRALLRAAPHGNLKVMLPMVAVADEYDRAAALFDGGGAEPRRARACRTRCRRSASWSRCRRSRSRRRPSLDVAFFSIGSNDLTQYVMAAARDNASVAHLNDVRHPAVLRLIAAVAAFGQRARHSGQPVRRCRRRPGARPGAAAGRPARPSVAPAQLAAGQGGDRRRRRAEPWRTRRFPSPGDAEEAIRAYKTILRRVLDQRPSGTRQRLADALGKNRSFVTQITSPAYSTPIPSKHLPLIFAVCHFTPQERDAFPRRLSASRIRARSQLGGQRPRACAHLSLTVPDLGDDKQNAALDRAINEFVHRISSIAGKGG